MDGYLFVFIVAYLICHIPAFILLIIGFVKLKKKPQVAKKLFIAALIYFLIGAGVCGALLS